MRCSVSQLCPTLCHPMDCSTLWTTTSVLTISQSLHKFISIESMKSSNHLVICQPFSSYLQSCPKSGSSLMSQLLASGGQSIRASGSASVLSTNIRVGTRISFKVDWFDLLSVQGTPKSLLQHHSSKASIFQCLAFFFFSIFILFYSHIHMWLQEKPQLWLYGPWSEKWCLCFSICCLGFS